MTPTPTPMTPTPTPMTPTPTPMTPTPTPSTPTPTPGKFGALTTINSPDPFVIDGGTVINTDPAITRAVTTGFGKIFRSTATDGSRSAWMFGTTSGFDNASGFDHGAAASFLDNIAGFKFQNLILESDPMMDTSGGTTNLALVAVNGITTGSSASTFTFAGIDTLLLATQNGSIDLMSGYTFNGPSRIFVYARGAASHLTIDSDITSESGLYLFSEGTVTIGGALQTAQFNSFSGGDFKNTSGRVTASSFSVTSQNGSISITTNSFRPGSGHISLALSAGGAINIRMGLDLSLFTSANVISLNGSRINLTTKSEVLTLNLNVASPATLTAGAGGIYAPNINFMTTGGLVLHSDGDIDIYGADIPLVNGHRTISGSIDAGGEFHAVSNVTTGAMTVGGGLTIDQGNLSVTSLSAGTTSEDSVDVGGDISASQDVTAAGSINAHNITAGTTIDVGGGLSAADVSAGGDFHAVDDVATAAMTVNGNVAVDNGNLSVTSLSAGSTFEDTVEVAGDISASQSVTTAGTIVANNVTAGTTINTGGALYVADVTAGGDINVGTDPGDDENPNFDRDIIATSVTAGGNVNAYGVAVPTISAHGVLTVGDDGIFPYVDPNVGADLQHTITADSVVSSGGIFFISAFYGGINGLSHGGLLTINARTILFDDGSQGIGFTDLDGANVGDFGGAVGEAGDGGTLIVRTTGNIATTADSVIIARTGLTPPDLPFGGTGGTVTLDSSGGSVSVDGLIRVSQATSFESHGDPQRRSENGGHINLHSGLTSGQAISILQDASLEALFHDDAPGEAGAINVISEGGDISVKGNLEAERGTITISNAGMDVAHPRPAGALSSLISLEGATLVTGTLNISSIGNLEIGLQNTATLDGVTTSLHADNDFSLGNLITLGTARETTGDVTLSAGHNFTFDNLDIERTNGGIFSGFNFSVEAEGNITGNQGLRLLVDHVSSTLSDGAHISVAAGQTLAVNALNLEVNNSGGQIGTGGTISVTANELNAGSVDAKINNQSGGSIGTGATIDFNVAQGASVTGNANLQVLGSSGAGGAAINVNGGDYDVGGTFRAFTDGDGTIGLNNAGIHADVLKVGALGPNGVLNIGGGTLSANTTLKLYASGSNGQLNFISDVSLNGNSAKILAANSVTIFDNVVVTVGGSNPASVYATNANYSEEWGGNSSTTGTFAGAGANAPQPLSSAPAFDDLGQASSTDSSVSGSSAPSTPPGRGGTGSVVVTDSSQLLSLLDGAAVGPGGKIIVPNAHGRSNPRNPAQRNPGEQMNLGRETVDARRKTTVGAKPLLP